MKGTEAFKQTIGQYLTLRAAQDGFFAERYRNPEKSLDDCIGFIIGKVQESGANGFTDDEIYSLAIHYYMEDGLKGKALPECQVIVNHQVQLTEEEIEEMKRKAKEELFEKETNRLRGIGRHTPVKTEPAEQLSLF